MPTGTLTPFNPLYPLNASDNVTLSHTAATNLNVQSVKMYASGATFATNFSVTAQSSAPRGLWFKPDGLAFWIVASGGTTIHQYALSSAWNVGTASYTSKSFSTATEDATPRGIEWKSDGSVFWVAGSTNSAIYQYNVGTPWDISTASYSGTSKSVTAEGTGAFDFSWNDDGTSFVVVTTTGTRTIWQYSVSTPWDLTGATYTGKSFTPSTAVDNMNAFFWKPGGRTFWMTGTLNRRIYEFTCVTAYDISTASYAYRWFSTTTDGENSPSTIFWHPDGIYFYTAGSTIDTVLQYSVSSPWTLGGVLPVDWVSGLTLSWFVEYRQAGRSDDTLGLDIRVMSGATVLAAADAGGTYATVASGITSATDVTAGPTAFAYVNTSATKDQWDVAQVDLQQRYTVSMGSDGAQVQTDYVQFTGTYTSTTKAPPPPPRVRAVQHILGR